MSEQDKIGVMAALKAGGRLTEKGRLMKEIAELRRRAVFWVPTSERLPDTDDYYIVTVRLVTGFAQWGERRFVRRSPDTPGRWEFRNPREKITAWLPKSHYIEQQTTGDEPV
jgi:hypothetical protein